MHFSLTSEQVSPLTFPPRRLTPHRFHPRSDTLCPSAMSIFTPTFVTLREPAEDISRAPQTPLQSNLLSLPHCFHLLQTPPIPSLQPLVLPMSQPFGTHSNLIPIFLRNCSEPNWFIFIFPTSLLLDIPTDFLFHGFRVHMQTRILLYCYDTGWRIPWLKFQQLLIVASGNGHFN